MEDDRKLDLIREEAARREKELIGQRENVREVRRDVEFAEEQMDGRMHIYNRIIRQEKVWEKQVTEQQEKIEIIKLAQSKTIDERDKLQRELNRKKESHQVQVEAWNKELAIIMREQAISAMIQESYVKEIDRVKKQQILLKAMMEESAEPIAEKPMTAGSVGHRFGSTKRVVLQQKAARRSNNNSTLRRMDSNSSMLKDKQRGGSVRQGVMINNSKDGGSSPSQKINELKQMKKELKREFKRQEAEVIAIQKREVTKNEQQQPSLQRKKTIGAGVSAGHAFRVPITQNFP